MQVCTKVSICLFILFYTYNFIVSCAGMYSNEHLSLFPYTSLSFFVVVVVVLFRFSLHLYRILQVFTAVSIYHIFLTPFPYRVQVFTAVSIYHIFLTPFSCRVQVFTAAVHGHGHLFFLLNTSNNAATV